MHTTCGTLPHCAPHAWLLQAKWVGHRDLKPGREKFFGYGTVKNLQRGVKLLYKQIIITVLGRTFVLGILLITMMNKLLALYSKNIKKLDKRNLQQEDR